MKSKIFCGALALLSCGLAFTACSEDEDYSVATTALLGEGSVVTGSSDVTATTATMHGSVTGLDNVSTSSYATGFYYGYSEGNLSEKVGASTATSFSATIDGLTDELTIYYQAYVTLQGRVTYKGEIKTLVTTDAKVSTAAAVGVTPFAATLSAAASDYTEDATMGFVISTSPDVETLRAAYRLNDSPATASRQEQVEGLQPGTDYYYAAYLDLGSGIVYGDVKSFTTDDKDYDANDDFVDLGLSVKWAKTNIGASSETAEGGLFAFGDLDGWNASIDPADYASDNTYRTLQDIAYKTYGGIATLPTAEQFEELFSLCQIEFTEGAYKLTGPNGNSIILPCNAKRYGYESENADATAYYATGSVNENNPKYYVDYEISSAGNGRNTVPTYTALAVRAVTSALSESIDKALLYRTWHLDIRPDGSSASWTGPLYYYGTDDSWRTATNGEPVIGDSWNWCPEYLSNTWLCSAQDYGTMTLREDGTVAVVRYAADGTETAEEGTYSIDENAKTITLSIDVLGLPNFNAVSQDVKNQLKIFSLGDGTMQIAILRDPTLSGEGACSLVYNYVSDELYQGSELDKSLLYHTWHIDLRADGGHAVWDGPMYYYGTDDSWNSVTNQAKVAGDSWNWCPDYAGNSWICAAQDYGTMTLREDGTVTIVRIAADGTETTEEGTYTIDETSTWNEFSKTITLSIDVLGIPQYNAVSKDVKTKLKIFSLTADKMQIAILRDAELSGEGACSLVYNYVTDEQYSGINVSLLAVGSDWGGTWGTVLATIMPQELDGQHTVTYNGAVNGAMVTLLDFVELVKRYPNAFVRIDEIKLDGQAIKFDANNFCYGDIEDKGNYRIEMFNIWGKGQVGNKIVASPFSSLTDVDSDPAFTFAESCEITFTVKTNGPVGTYTPNLITINPSWDGTWGFNQGTTFDVVLNTETAKYELSRRQFNILYTTDGTDYTGGSEMTFIEIADIYAFFPTMHATLDGLKLDGQSISYDVTKVPDSNESPKYRLELWNPWGATGGNGYCAFGEIVNGQVVPGLAFSSTMEVDFTIRSLFAVPEW